MNDAEKDAARLDLQGHFDADYLDLKGRIWRLRRRVPASVQPYERRREIYISTRTSDRGAAIVIARRINRELEAYWQTLAQAGSKDSAQKRFREVERPGSAPLAIPPASDPLLSDAEKARRLLAERRASSRTAADVAANVAIDSVAGPAGAAELRGRATWGKFVASVGATGERRLAYEVASSAGQRPMMFRNADGVQVQVTPQDNVFVLRDPRLLASRPDTTAVELDVFRVNEEGTAEPGTFDTIKIERFPTSAAPAQRRGAAVSAPPTRTAGLTPN